MTAGKSGQRGAMYLRIHQTAGGRVVAVCDEALIGKVITEKNRQLDLDRYRGFYVGDKCGREEVEEALKEFSSLNLVGKEAVKVALELGLASENDVMYINYTPYIQIYNL